MRFLAVVGVIASCARPAPPPLRHAPAAPANAAPTTRTPEQIARERAREPLAKAVVNTYWNKPPLLTPGGKLSFVSNRDGNDQLYVADASAPSAAPLQLTHGPDRADLALVAHDGTLVYRRDENADENWRLAAIDADGSHDRILTPGPVMRRGRPLEPRDTPGVLVYTQRSTGTAQTAIAQLKLAGGEPTIAYTDSATASLVDVTADGSRALLVRWVSSSDLAVVEVDLRSGKAHVVYPQPGIKLAVHDARYAADGKNVLVATDDRDGLNHLLLVNGTTGAELARHDVEPATAQIATIETSPRGDRIAALLDAGDHHELHLLDGKSLALRAKAAFPLGFIDPARFSPDGTQMLVTFSAPDTPYDVYAVDAGSGTVTPMRKEPRSGLDGLPRLDVTVDHVKAFDGLDLPVNVYRPVDRVRKHAVIAIFHGGPADSSHVGWSGFVRFFTALGYVVVEPNVRGSTGFGRAFEMADNREKRADWLRDVATINEWLKTRSWADPQRLVIMGGSYGGYTVLMALTRQPTAWRAGVDMFGPADLVTELQTTDAAIRAGFVEEMGDLDKDRALLEQFSPIHDADKIVRPLFVFAGAHDPRVPRSESDTIVKAARAHGVTVEYMVAENEGHSLSHSENMVEILVRVARFLDDNAR